MTRFQKKHPEISGNSRDAPFVLQVGDEQHGDDAARAGNFFIAGPGAGAEPGAGLGPSAAR